MVRREVLAVAVVVTSIGSVAYGEAEFVDFDLTGSTAGFVLVNGEFFSFEEFGSGGFSSENAGGSTSGGIVEQYVSMFAETFFGASIVTNEFGIQQVLIGGSGSARVETTQDPPKGDDAEIGTAVLVTGPCVFVDEDTPFTFRILSFDGGPFDRLTFDRGARGVLPAGSISGFAGSLGVSADFEQRTGSLSLQAALTLTTPADITLDGVVDTADLVALLAAWGSESGLADVNVDGIVDFADLIELLASWS